MRGYGPRPKDREGNEVIFIVRGGLIHGDGGHTYVEPKEVALQYGLGPDCYLEYTPEIIRSFGEFNRDSQVRCIFLYPRDGDYYDARSVHCVPDPGGTGGASEITELKNEIADLRFQFNEHIRLMHGAAELRSYYLESLKGEEFPRKG